MRRSRAAIGPVVAVVLTAASAACKSDPPSRPSPGASCATITIANNTVSPRSVTVTRGCQVTFTNNDSRGHTMSSDPHPEHTECPELNVGTVGPGKAPPHGLSRDEIERAIGGCGFQLWRVKPKQPSPESQPEGT